MMEEVTKLVLGEKEVKEVLAEKFGVEPYDVEIKYWEDNYYGCKSMTAYIKKKGESLG